MHSGSHLSKELFELVKSIGECRSKQEEDKIILQEMTTLKNKLNEANIQPKKMKELMIRTIYVEMLGHDASFAHIHAINLSQNRNLMCKRLGYLTCCLCLPQDSQMLILLVATLQRDLGSQNYLEIVGALNTIAKVATPSLVHALFDHVIRLVNHINEVVRKKAVSVLFKFVRLVPTQHSDSDQHFRRALCDKDPSVMAASLNYFHETVAQVSMRSYYKDLIPSFVLILKQVIEHRLPKDYDYHRMPAPWTQIKILEILGSLGADDKTASEQMYEILGDVMRRADDIGINAGYAIVYQCLLSVSKIYPNPALIESAAQCISRFIGAENHNLKYTGITGLISIVKLNPQYAARHQMVVVDCLEDTDETLKRKTLSLLYRMANVNNVKVIVDKLLGILKSTSIDQHLKSELVVNISALAEKYAPDSRWYLRVMNSMIELASDQVTPDIISNLIKLISDWRDDEGTIAFVLDEYMKMLKNATHIHDAFMQISSWVLGEFGAVLLEAKRQELSALLCKAMTWRFENDLTRGWIVTALLKICHGILADEVKETISKFSSSRNEDIQQRCYEFAGFSTRVQTQFPLTAALEERFDPNLTFLNDFVEMKLRTGARAYNPDKNRRNLTYMVSKSRQEDSAADPLHSLKMDAYDAPAQPSSLPRGGSMSVPMESAGGLAVKKVAWTREGYMGVGKEGPKPQASITVSQEAPRFTPTSATQVQEPVRTRSTHAPELSQRDIEKQRLAASIFGGLGPQAEEPPPQQPVYQRPVQPKSNPSNLLDL